MNLQRSIVGFGALLFASISMGWAADHVVTANPNLTFTPAHLTINAGDTVTFTNAGGFHNAVVANGSGSLRCAMGCDGHGGNGNPSSANWTATVAFNTAGTFGFHCEIHVSDGMIGTVTVNDVAPPPPPPPSITIAGYMSGNWFDPDQGGHGFQIEAATNNNMLAIWFVYALDGSSQNWIYAQGSYDSTKNTVTLPAFLSSGAKFPPNFKPTDVTTTPWGNLTFTFVDCNHGTVSWNSTEQGYGQGTLPITRLTQIDGTTCPQ